MDEAERLFTEIWIYTIDKWVSIHNFRRIAALGLPHVTPHLYNEYQTIALQLAYDKEYVDKYLNSKKFVEAGLVNTMPAMLLEKTTSLFQASIDAASLVFAHSLLDASVLDYCKVCSIVCPRDFEPFVINKRTELKTVKEKTYDEILELEIDEYLRNLEKESLIKKLDLLFGLCKPPAGYAPMKDYAYDRPKIIQLDDLRHSNVHGDGTIKPLLNGNEDIRYLEKTFYFLTPLVHDRYGVKINPNLVQEIMMKKGNK